MAMFAPQQASSGSSSEWENAPEGTYATTCIDVVNMGWKVVMSKNQKTGVEKEVERPYIQFVFLIDELKSDGKPYMIYSRQFNWTHSDRGNLHKLLLMPWKGKKFADTPSDMELLIGQNAQISVVHNEVGNTTYANIGAIMPAGKKQESIVIEDYDRINEREGYTPRPGFTLEPRAVDANGDFVEPESDGMPW